MKNERCKVKKIDKKIVDFGIFSLLLVLCSNILQGSYFEKNIYYKLEDMTIEIGEKLPEEMDKYVGLLDSENYQLETNASKDSEGRLNKIGEYTYFIVYNNPKNKNSQLTNVRAKLNIVDTIKPTLTVKDNRTFDYGSTINPEDIVNCIDLSGCSLKFKEDFNTSESGNKEITIIATDEALNESIITTNITIKDKPIIVYNNYYSASIEQMNNNNQQLNNNMTNDEKVDLRNRLISFAKQFVGNPYVYGGTSLTNGTDCSGFTMSVYSNFGYQLPRSAVSQLYMGIPVDSNNLQVGDLVVYYYGHVGIYLGSGMMVHAGTSQTGIVIAPIFAGNYTFRRVIY